MNLNFVDPLRLATLATRITAPRSAPARIGFYVAMHRWPEAVGALSPGFCVLLRHPPSVPLWFPEDTAVYFRHLFPSALLSWSASPPAVVVDVRVLRVRVGPCCGLTRWSLSGMSLSWVPQ